MRSDENIHSLINAAIALFVSFSNLAILASTSLFKSQFAFLGMMLTVLVAYNMVRSTQEKKEEVKRIPTHLLLDLLLRLLCDLLLNHLGGRKSHRLHILLQLLMDRSIVPEAEHRLLPLLIHFLSLIRHDEGEEERNGDEKRLEKKKEIDMRRRERRKRRRRWGGERDKSKRVRGEEEGGGERETRPNKTYIFLYSTNKL